MTERNSPDNVRMSELLAADAGHEIDFEPERLPLTARMHTEIWPLLPSQPPITKQEREQILGYDPETGV